MVMRKRKLSLTVIVQKENKLTRFKYRREINNESTNKTDAILESVFQSHLSILSFFLLSFLQDFNKHHVFTDAGSTDYNYSQEYL